MNARALLRLWRDRSGAALAEAAIAVPTLAIIFAGIFVLGATLYNGQLAETAARDAARYLARTDAPSANETTARNLAVFANTTGAGNPRFPGLNTDNVLIGYRNVANPVDALTGERAYRGASAIEVVEVSVGWTSLGAGLWALFGIESVRYVATHQERVIGD